MDKTNISEPTQTSNISEILNVSTTQANDSSSSVTTPVSEPSSLIERLGGYERAKDALELPLNYDFSDEDIKAALLEYRRAHNIFEVGDRVVVKQGFYDAAFNDHFDSKELFEVRAIGTLMLIRKGDWLLTITSNLVRHAEPEEIAAGRRIGGDV